MNMLEDNLHMTNIHIATVNYQKYWLNHIPRFPCERHPKAFAEAKSMVPRSLCNDGSLITHEHSISKLNKTVSHSVRHFSSHLTDYYATHYCNNLILSCKIINCAEWSSQCTSHLKPGTNTLAIKNKPLKMK